MSDNDIGYLVGCGALAMMGLVAMLVGAHALAGLAGLWLVTGAFFSLIAVAAFIAWVIAANA